MLYPENVSYRQTSDQLTATVSNEQQLSYFSSAYQSTLAASQSPDFGIATNNLDPGNNFNNGMMLMNNNYFPATTSATYNNPAVYGNWSSPFSNVPNQPPIINTASNFNIALAPSKGTDQHSNFDDKENLPVVALDNDCKENSSTKNQYPLSTIVSNTLSNSQSGVNANRFSSPLQCQNTNSSPNQLQLLKKEFSSNIEELRYWERRQKNNEAAKQSRSKRRDRENFLKQKVEVLEIENKRLKAELNDLRSKYNSKIA